MSQPPGGLFYIANDTAPRFTRRADAPGLQRLGIPREPDDVELAGADTWHNRIWWHYRCIVDEN